MLIVFFGTPEFAVPSLEALIKSRHRVAAVVSQPDRPKGRGQHLQATPTKVVAEANGIPVLQPSKIRDEAFLDRIRAIAPDLGVVVAFGRILPDALIAIPRLGLINLHASILPRYRGAAPIQRAVMAGDAETGVTIMRIERELDAGATFAMQGVPVPPEATSGDLESTLATVGARLLMSVVDAMEDGTATETPQDHSQATFAPKIAKEEGVIDWSEPAARIHDRVRGLQPWPLASTTLNGLRIVIRKTLPRANPRKGPDADLSLPGGTVIGSTGTEIIVACGGRTELRILELQPEGRRSMSVRDFLAGHKVAAGDRFGQ
jgi:methionyl-tRNA formyltransferase